MPNDDERSVPGPYLKKTREDWLEQLLKAQNKIRSNKQLPDDIKNIDEYIKVNIKFGVTILQALKKSNIKLFIYSSSLWQDLLGEQKNLYTLSKQHFDDYLKYFSIESKFNILSLYSC